MSVAMANISAFVLGGDSSKRLRLVADLLVADVDFFEWRAERRDSVRSYIIYVCMLSVW